MDIIQSKVTASMCNERTIHATTHSETSYDQRYQRPYSLSSQVWRLCVCPLLFPTMQISEYIFKNLLFYGNSCLFTTLEKKLWIATPTNEREKWLFFSSYCLFFLCVLCKQALTFSLSRCCFQVSANLLIVIPSITHTGRFSQSHSSFPTSIICNVSMFCFCNTISIEVYFKAFFMFYYGHYFSMCFLTLGNKVCELEMPQSSLFLACCGHRIDLSKIIILSEWPDKWNKVMPLRKWKKNLNGNKCSYCDR